MVDLFTGANLNITEAIVEGMGAVKKGDNTKFVGDMATNPFLGRCVSAKTSLTDQGIDSSGEDLPWV